MTSPPPLLSMQKALTPSTASTAARGVAAGEEPHVRQHWDRIRRASEELTRSLKVGSFVIPSKRDPRLLDSLVKQMGREGVVEACAKLAEASGLPIECTPMSGSVLTQRLAVAARGDASFHLEEVARLLSMRSCT